MFSDYSCALTIAPQNYNFENNSKKSRVIISGRLNFTSSVQDTNFSIKEIDVFDINHFNGFTDAELFIQNYKGDIEDHIDFRVSLFALQAMCVFSTHKQFEIAPTVLQGGRASSLTINYCDNNSKKKLGSVQHKRHAAHNSTLPSIKDINEKKTFLSGTSYDFENNSTADLPEIVNQTDSLIDGSDNDEFLRNLTLKNLNKISKDVRQLDAGMHHFIEDSIKVISKRLEDPSNKKYEQVLTIYKNRLKELKNTLEKKPTYIARLFGLDPKKLITTDISIQKLVFSNHAKNIQQNQKLGSDIFSSIDKIFNAVSIAKTKPYLRDAILHHVADSMPDVQERVQLLNLFGISPKAYSQRSGYKRSITDKENIPLNINLLSRSSSISKITKEILNKEKATLQPHIDEIHRLINEAKTKRLEKVGLIIEQLCQQHLVTEDELIWQLQHCFPEENYDSHILNKIDSKVIEHIAYLFDVDPEVIFPNFWW